MPKRVITAILLAVAAVVIPADTSHSMTRCSATFYMDPQYARDYHDATIQALGIVSRMTGLRFSESSVTPDITFREFTAIPYEVHTVALGWYDYAGGIGIVTPRLWRALSGVHSVNNRMKTGLVVHEVLHWYGLSHNTTDRGSIMSPMEHQRPDPSEWFGPSDLAAIKKISDWRGC